MNFESVGGRRWVGFLVVMALATWLNWVGRLTPAWVDLALYLYATFAGVNLVQKGIDAVREVKGAGAAKTAGQTDPPAA